MVQLQSKLQWHSWTAQWGHVGRCGKPPKVTLLFGTLGRLSGRLSDPAPRQGPMNEGQLTEVSAVAKVVPNSHGRYIALLKHFFFCRGTWCVLSVASSVFRWALETWAKRSLLALCGGTFSRSTVGSNRVVAVPCSTWLEWQETCWFSGTTKWGFSPQAAAIVRACRAGDASAWRVVRTLLKCGPY